MEEYTLSYDEYSSEEGNTSSSEESSTEDEYSSFEEDSLVEKENLMCEKIALNDPSITCVIRDELDIRELNLERFVAALHHNTKVEYVGLSEEYDFGDYHARLFADMLRVNVGITELRLPNCDISDEGAQHLCASLEENSSLAFLDLGANQIEDVRPIFTTLKKNTSLRCLKLDYNPASASWGRAAGEALRVNHTLTSLVLARLGIGDEDATELFEALRDRRSPLCMLDLGGNKIGDAAAPSLRKLLQCSSCALQHLQLKDNRMGDEAAEHIAAALAAESCTLKYLDISGSNIITSTGLGHLGDALRCNASLCTAFFHAVASDSPRNEGAVRILAALARNRTLTSLNLTWSCPDGEEWARALASSLATNTTLTVLDLRSSRTCSSLVGPLGEALVLNETLTKLFFGNLFGRGTKDFGAHLIPAVAFNCSLISLSSVHEYFACRDAVAHNEVLNDIDGRKWKREEEELEGAKKKDAVLFRAPVFIVTGNDLSPPKLVKIALRGASRPDGSSALRCVVIDPELKTLLDESVTARWSTPRAQGTQVRLSAASGEPGGLNLALDFALPRESIAKIAGGPPALCTADVLARLFEQRASRFTCILGRAVAVSRIAALIEANPEHEDLLGVYLGPRVRATFAEGTYVN